MNLCRVVGDVVAPVKNPRLEGEKLLLCQPVDLEDRPRGATSIIALDRVTQAGEGDLVLVNMEGGGARIIYGDEATPVRAVIVAVVDGFHIDRRDLALPWHAPPPAPGGGTATEPRPPPVAVTRLPDPGKKRK